MNTSATHTPGLNPQIPGIIDTLSQLFPGQIDAQKWTGFLAERTDKEISALEQALEDMKGKIFDPEQITSKDLMDFLPDLIKFEETCPVIQLGGDFDKKLMELTESPLWKLLELSDETVGKIIKSTGNDYSTHKIDVDRMENSEIGKRIKEVLVSFAQKNIDEVQQICDRLLQEGKRRKII